MFPPIQFKSTNTESDTRLQTLLEQKFQSLSKYIGDSSAICNVEFEKLTAKQHGQVFRVEANLEVDGTLYRAEATLENFEQAIDEVRAELDKELRRASSKRDTLLKRGGRRLKNMLRFGNEG